MLCVGCRVRGLGQDSADAKAKKRRVMTFFEDPVVPGDFEEGGEDLDAALDEEDADEWVDALTAQKAKANADARKARKEAAAKAKAKAQAAPAHVTHLLLGPEGGLQSRGSRSINATIVHGL